MGKEDLYVCPYVMAEVFLRIKRNKNYEKCERRNTKFKSDSDLILPGFLLIFMATFVVLGCLAL